MNVPIFDERVSPSPSIAPEEPGHEEVPRSAPHSVITDTTQPPGDLSMRTPVPPNIPMDFDDLERMYGSERMSKTHSLDEPHAVEPDSKRQRVEELDEPTANAEPSSSAMEVRNDTWVMQFDYEKSSLPEEKIVHNYLPRFCLLTRKEQKALDKEIPWHMIPEDQQEGYAEALVKEWGTWCKYEATKPLDLAASSFVENNVDKKRILDTRVCYRNKNAAYPWLPVKHKARIVCRGDRDPDITVLRRDAPTMTRLSLMVLLQVAAAKSQWFLFNADITGAFLQGDQKLASRKEALYLRQPREGLPGLVRGQLLLVVRGIFGLANSPRLFWRHLRDSLIRLGFVQSTLDRAVFFFYKQEKLILALGAHVDDLIGTGEPGEADYVLDELKKTFDFGAWADSRTDEVLEYGGKQIRKHPDGRITLTQEKFVRAATLSPIPKWRLATPNSELLGKEMTELRSAGGCLHWLVGQTRPDLAAGTSLFMSGKPTVHHLTQLNRLLKEAKNSETWGLTFRPIDLEEAKVVVFSDSSWANTEELKSQAGFMVLLAGGAVDTVAGDTVNLVDWRSHRIKRQCRSTLAAETMAMDAAMDAGIYCREFLSEMLIKEYIPSHCGRLPRELFPVIAVTDCRSLYDLLVKDGPVSTTQEKRLAIDIGGLKETAAEFDEEQEKLSEIFRWIATDMQWADHLTKVKPAYMLRQILDEGFLALRTVVEPDQT